MSLIVFAIIVVIFVALLISAIRITPLPAPTNWILQVLVLVLGAVIIAARAGIL